MYVGVFFCTLQIRNSPQDFRSSSASCVKKPYPMWSKPFKLRTSNLFGIQLLKSLQHWPCFLWDLDTTQHLCIPPVVPNMTFRNSHSVFIPSKNVVACEETPILKLVQKHCHYHWPRDLENFFSCFKLQDGKKKQDYLQNLSFIYSFPKCPYVSNKKQVKIKNMYLFHISWHYSIPDISETLPGNLPKFNQQSPLKSIPSCCLSGA